jgi:hypothetical protein
VVVYLPQAGGFVMAVSRYMNIKQGVMNRIDSLSLKFNNIKVNLLIFKLPVGPERFPGNSEIPGEQKKVYSLQSDGRPKLPVIEITQVASEAIQQNAGTDTRYGITWPVQVTIVAKDDLNLIANDDTYLYWRERLFDSFVSQPLPGVSAVWYTVLDPLMMVNTDAFLSKDLFISAMVLRFLERRQSNPVVPDPIPLVVP